MGVLALAKLVVKGFVFQDLYARVSVGLLLADLGNGKQLADLVLLQRHGHWDAAATKNTKT